MALIQQNRLFDRLQTYIDKKMAELPKELEDLFAKYGLDEIMAHIDEIALVEQNIGDIVAVANNLTYVIWVGHEIDAVRQCALNLDDIRNYGDTYYGPADKDPIKRPDGSEMKPGDMYFNTLNNAMMVLNSMLVWIEAGSPFDAVQNSCECVATAGQDTFNVIYDPGNINVYINGVLLDSDSYTALDGQVVVLDTPLSGGENVYIRSFGTFKLADHFTKTETLLYFAQRNGSQNQRFNVDWANEATHAVSLSQIDFILQNYSDRSHRHDNIYFTKDEHVYSVDPEVGNPNVPVVTSPLTGKIDSTLLDICGFTLHGTFTPSTSQEYPDTFGVDYGAFWVIDGLLDGEEYTYSTGDLAGKSVRNNNLIMFGKDGWIISKTELSPEAYVKRDGSNTMIGNLSFNNTYLPTNLKDPYNDTDATNKKYVDDGLIEKADLSGATFSGHISVPEGPEPWQVVRRDYVDSFKNMYAPIDHLHNDFNEINDVDGTSLRDALAEKATEAALYAHSTDTNNPHNVTAAQLGALTGTWSLDTTNGILYIDGIPEV